MGAFYRKWPTLRRATADAFEANFDIVQAMISGRRQELERSRLDALDDLIARHLEYVVDEELREAWTTWRRELADPAVQQSFRVRIQSSGGD